MRKVPLELNYSSQRPLRVISLGAGTQSSDLYSMAAEGELPPCYGEVDIAIFSCTQYEPEQVYQWLQMLAGVDYEEWVDHKGHINHRAVPGLYRGGRYGAKIPVLVVTGGNIRESYYEAQKTGKRYVSLPVFVKNPDGGRGMGRRQCTKDFKIEQIIKAVRGLVGLKPRQIGPREVIVHQLIGISIDEVVRMKPSRVRWIRHVWPLVDMGKSRQDCVRSIEAKGLGKPPKSACKHCPYTENERWLDMQQNRPDEFAGVVDFDREIRNGGPRGLLIGENYVHSSLKPLDEVDFTKDEGGTVDFFNDECEGMCGV